MIGFTMESGSDSSSYESEVLESFEDDRKRIYKSLRRSCNDLEQNKKRKIENRKAKRNQTSHKRVRNFVYCGLQRTKKKKDSADKYDAVRGSTGHSDHLQTVANETQSVKKLDFQGSMLLTILHNCNYFNI